MDAAAVQSVRVTFDDNIAYRIIGEPFPNPNPLSVWLHSNNARLTLSNKGIIGSNVKASQWAFGASTFVHSQIEEELIPLLHVSNK